jgi:antirestriction protein ArdC
MQPNVKAVLDNILERFKTGDVPEAVAYSMFPIPDLPSSKWSILNRTIMFFSGTHDARGYRQWNEANRYVKKGSKSLYILVPFIKKVEDDAGQEKDALYGFGCKPVFRVEDTDGEPLEYQQIELPQLPLMERAEEWGISVKAIPGNYSYRGYYSPDRREVCLGTPQEKTFFHELSHCAHERVKGNLKNGQDPFQEIVAELSAQALCRIVGKTGERHLGNSYQYIERYADRLKISAYSACIRVLNETEKVLNLILQGDQEDIQTPAKLAA